MAAVFEFPTQALGTKFTKSHHQWRLSLNSPKVTISGAYQCRHSLAADVQHQLTPRTLKFYFSGDPSLRGTYIAECRWRAALTMELTLKFNPCFPKENKEKKH